MKEDKLFVDVLKEVIIAGPYTKTIWYSWKQERD